jgi:hypothetical protein
MKTLASDGAPLRTAPTCVLDGGHTLHPDFLESYFQKDILLGRIHAAPQLPWCDIFSIVRNAFSRKRLRFVVDGVELSGAATEQLDARLAGAELSGVFESILQNGTCSFVVQGCEAFSPEVQKLTDDIGQQLDCRVSCAAFISPPLSRATDIHYDLADVFAVQIHGTKVWELYKPVDPLPDFEDKKIDIAQGDAVLEHVTTCTLEPGDLLYVPRGWVHNVRNGGELPSVHLSLVAFLDSWMSVFENFAKEALADMRRHKQHATHVTPTLLASAMAKPGLDSMLQDFAARMDRLCASPQRAAYLNNCLTHRAQRGRLAGAAVSIDMIAGDAVEIAMSGAHYILKADGENVALSTDSERFIVVPRSLYEAVALPGVVAVADLTGSGRWGEEALLKFFEICVVELGVFVFRDIPSTDRSHGAENQFKREAGTWIFQ